MTRDIRKGRKLDPSKVDGSTFTEMTYAYARNWARQNRRHFLRNTGFGLAALAAGTGLGPLAARAQQPGGSIRIARGQESDTLDPHKTSLLVAHEIAWQIYDSLIYLDEQGTVFPGLATAWEFANDNKTVIFTLREGVTFHDGTPFDAAAVKFSADRHLDPATASPTSWVYGPIESVEVIDDMTVAYHYSEPFVALWVGLSYAYCAPVSPTAVAERGDQFGRNPVGTGPYKFVSWVPDQGITLERNDAHDWATPFYSNEGAGYLDRVTYVVIPEDATRLAALQSGEVDVVSGTDAVPIDAIRRLERTEGLTVYRRPAAGLYYSYINTQIKPLDDVRVRKAINFAVDKEKIIALALDGAGQTAYSPVASAFGSYNPAVREIGYDHDLDRARALMEEAGQSEGFTLDYLVIEGPLYRRIAEIVQQDLAQINITVNIQSYPVGELFALAPQGQAGMTFFYYTWSDADIVYALLKSGQAMSWAFQDDAELDEMLEAQRAEFDPEVRQDLLNRIQERAVDEALWLYLFEGEYVAAMGEHVKGLTLNLVGFHHLQEIWVENG